MLVWKHIQTGAYTSICSRYIYIYIHIYIYVTLSLNNKRETKPGVRFGSWMCIGSHTLAVLFCFGAFF